MSENKTELPPGSRAHMRVLVVYLLLVYAFLRLFWNPQMLGSQWLAGELFAGFGCLASVLLVEKIISTHGYFRVHMIWLALAVPIAVTLLMAIIPFGHVFGEGLTVICAATAAYILFITRHPIRRY